MTSPHLFIPTTKVILVRHARTTYNEQGRYQGSSDESVLTEKGHQDAFLTGLALQQYKFDAIYTSPLMRVQQTTEAIITALKQKNNSPPVQIDPLLTEICMSDWQGLYYQEVKERYATGYRCWQETPHLFNFNNLSFPVIELFEQAQKFWQKVLTQHRGKTILIVAHGGTNRALISTAIGLNPENYHSLQQSNCGISYLEFPQKKLFGKLIYFNRTYHLGETLPKLKAGKMGYRWLLLSNKIIKELATNLYFQQITDNHLINLLLADHSDSDFLADKSLINHKTLNFSIDRNSSIKSLQQYLCEQQIFESNLEKATLVTGIVVASDLLISQILRETLTLMNPLDIGDYLAVIHSPQANRHSILQGILPLNEKLAPQLY
ncbi:MAG: histidine phosphatase family protein [Microcoleaceae cyanobacterium]